MKRYQTKPVSLTVFRLSGPEEIDEAIAMGERAGWPLGIVHTIIKEVYEVSVAHPRGGYVLLNVDNRFQALCFDEDPDTEFPWFVINMPDLWSIYREVPG